MVAMVMGDPDVGEGPAGLFECGENGCGFARVYCRGRAGRLIMDEDAVIIAADEELVN